ncbi:hypothetical protein E5161_07885 [Cohnella pontilimi]|uniref:Uncharacterized protein n=1 Tax=Cohnella pontilimi TaxID=2564100 RepID=A0A4U0FH72_9BACL|nr:hypothetical protein [Cohnella pontilimi]TJY42752.1 hypothetical protein E5161_07885 [Cohnella pontilimi]
MKKKSKKWKRIMLWSLILFLLIGSSGLAAFNYLANKVLESMSESLFSETADVSASDKPPNSSSTSHEKGQSAISIGTNSEQNNNEVKSGGQAAAQDDRPGVYDSQVTKSKAKAISESVTLSDKAVVTSILMAHLTMHEINQLKALASGGLTVEEKRQARKILLGKLTPKEYDKLSGIAKKYGVSRGKTYSEVVKEEQSTQ